MNKIEVLMAARALVERGWCRGAQAKERTHGLEPWDTALVPACVYDPNATHFCAEGAVYRALGKAGMQSACYVHNLLVRSIPETERALSLPPLPSRNVERLPAWNDYDGRTKEEVLALFDHAIARVKAKNAERRQRRLERKLVAVS